MNYSEAVEKLQKVASLLSEAFEILDEVKYESDRSDGKSLTLTMQDLMYENITPQELARKLFKN